MKSLEDYILENLEKHINIDYELFEHAGLYDGVEDIARFLTNKIKSHQEKEFKIIYKDTDRELSKFKNIFFSSAIKLICNHNSCFRNYCFLISIKNFNKQIVCKIKIKFFKFKLFNVVE